MDTQSQQQSVHSNGDDGDARSEFLRNRAIVNAILSGMPVAEAARRHDVTRQWAHELKRRYEKDGEAGLLPRSRRAHRIANKTDGRVAERIVAIRRELTAGGLDAGAESIAARLEREGATPPANSTIHRILRDAGLVRPEPRKRPKSSYTRFEAVLPNETWQLDFTHWPIAGGEDALVVSWLDDHSRFLLYSRAYATVTMKVIEESFRQACSRYGIPASTLTDNGTVYTTRLHSAEPGAFERLLALMGVRQKNGSPYHPQTQGKIERWHRTLKQWLAARPLARDLDELNAQLDGFRHEYNEERPHRALNRHTPREAYEAKGKAGPDPEIAVREQARRDEEARAANERDAAEGKTRRRRPVPAAERTEPVRVDVTVPAKPHKVSKDGCIAQKGIAGGRRTVNVGRENAGKIVELEITHGTIIVVDPATGEILADQTLDTTRDYQYRKPMPGVNHAPRHLSIMPQDNTPNAWNHTSKKQKQNPKHKQFDKLSWAGPSRDHGQARLGAVQRLDLALLVHAQHDRMLRGRHVQAHHVRDLLREPRVVRHLERIRQMRLEAKFPPYPVDRGTVYVFNWMLRL